MRIRLPRPRHATVVAYVALFVAMGGTAVAATGGSFILGHGNKANQPTSLKNTAYGPALKLVNGHAGAPPFTINGNKHVVPGLNSALLGGHGPSYYQRAGNLPSGKSESGMFSAGDGPNTTAGGWVGYGVTYPRPLAHAIANSHIVDVPGNGPVTHCPGPGHAARGYLCLYNSISSDVGAGYGYSSGSGFSSPSVGVVLYWPVTGSNAYAGGEWTVTAP